MKKIPILLLFVLAASCMKPNSDHLRHDGLIYFDLKGLVGQQAALLSSQNCKLEKEVLVNGQVERNRLDTVRWAQELRPFANADINKPVLAEAYKKSEYVEDGRKKEAYTAKNQTQEVKKIVITYQNGQVSEVEIDYAETNPVYDSKREMQMFLEHGRLASYKVFGYQKMRVQDTLRYELAAKVIQ